MHVSIVSIIFDNLCHKFVLKLLAKARETDKKDLLSELEVMKTLKPHRHVIKLLGCVTESGKRDKLFKMFVFEHKNVRNPPATATTLSSGYIVCVFSRKYYWPNLSTLRPRVKSTGHDNNRNKFFNICTCLHLKATPRRLGNNSSYKSFVSSNHFLKLLQC